MNCKIDKELPAKLRQLELAAIVGYQRKQGNISRSISTARGPMYQLIVMLQVLEQSLSKEQFKAILEKWFEELPDGKERADLLSKIIAESERPKG